MIVATKTDGDKMRQDDQLIGAYPTGYRHGLAAAVRSIQAGPAVKARRWWDNRMKKGPHDGGKGGARSAHQTDGHFTADKLAERHGVSAPTIERDGRFAAAHRALTVEDIPF